MLLGKFFLPRKLTDRIILRVKAAELPKNGALIYKQSRVAVINTSSKPYALNLSCTHLGCTVNIQQDEFVCPCHGSRFDIAGNVLKGPAAKALDRHLIQEDEETLIVHE